MAIPREKPPSPEAIEVRQLHRPIAVGGALLIVGVVLSAWQVLHLPARSAAPAEIGDGRLS